MISVVINTLNEEEHIADCIDSVREFADEVLVCDMYSDDDTVSIAEGLGARVIYHKRTGFVEPARHIAISKAKYEWILVIDADERLTYELAQQLKAIAIKDNYDLVLFCRMNYYFGDFVRLKGFLTKRTAQFFRKQVYLETYDEKIDRRLHGNFASLVKYAPRQFQMSYEYYVLHLSYPTIEKYVCKTLGMYARIEAEQYFQQGQKFSLSRMLSETLRLFIGRYLIRQGFRIGMRGFILSVLMAGYRFLIWANLWLLEETTYRK